MRSMFSRGGFALLSLASLLTGTGCASTSNRPELVAPKNGTAENVHVGLLALLEAKPGKEAEVQKFLEDTGTLVRGEATTVQWFALRLGPTSFAIFDTFADEAGLQAHINGQVAATLGARAPELLDRRASIEKADVLATKAPGAGAPDVHEALLVTLEAKSGKEDELQKFLEGALPVVRNEPDTLHWYAIRLSRTKFGIVDTFVKDSGRQAHLNGQVAAALGARAAELLAWPPSIEKAEVIAAKP